MAAEHREPAVLSVLRAGMQPCRYSADHENHERRVRCDIADIRGRKAIRQYGTSLANTITVSPVFSDPCVIQLPLAHRKRAGNHPARCVCVILFANPFFTG
jgi:hypothetical protein